MVPRPGKPGLSHLKNKANCYPTLIIKLMKEFGMNSADINTKWRSWEKILFRFFSVWLLVLSQIAYNPLLEVLGYNYNEQRMILNRPLVGVVSWLDDSLFHIGYLPDQHAIDFSDTHFGVILFLAILLVSVIACILWTLFDKKRANYNRIYYWCSNYLAYYIFLAMITYAVYKVIPIQAHYPTAPELLTRWGDLRNWEILFRFMGTSPAYCMFCGWLELIASVLILFNRTRVPGGLLMAIVLVQVVCFNIFYNNNIILLSGILLLATIFIIAKALPKLFEIFIRLRPVSLAQRQYRFITPWKKYVMVLICFLPVWKVYTVTKKGWNFYKGHVRNQANQRLYNVMYYRQENDVIPPLTTDTVRWKYVCFLDYGPDRRQAVIFDMQDNQSALRCRWDSLGKKIIFAGKDSVSFSYRESLGGKMELNGYWHGKNTSIQLTRLNVDSLNLVKDKFLFMQEDQ
ncbi:MAG TPA: hypothetical protein VGQ04_07555 [Chitinophagaceae bacterium]|nr:hypothetical protein [Chitinophagaceae bacterium]